MSERNPVIEYRSESNYANLVPEISEFILDVSEAVAQQLGYSKDELYLTNFKDDHDIIVEYETEEGTETVRLEQDWDQPYTIQQYQEFLEEKGVENITDMYVTELKPASSDLAMMTGSSWNYDAQKKSLHFHLSTEDDTLFAGSEDTVDFIGSFTVAPYTIDSRTETREMEGMVDNIRRKLGFEPRKYEVTVAENKGTLHMFEIFENFSYGDTPTIGQISEDKVQSIYEQVKDSGNYSLNP